MSEWKRLVVAVGPLVVFSFAVVAAHERWPNPPPLVLEVVNVAVLVGMFGSAAWMVINVVEAPNPHRRCIVTNSPAPRTNREGDQEVNEPCAARGCETPMSADDWHETERGGHSRRSLTGVLDRLDHLERVFGAVFDLDRCPHGRHERDVCSTCSNASMGALQNIGNPFADEPCGYTIGGQPVTPRILHGIASEVVQ